MKRSEINKIMRKAVDFFKEQNFYLPKFAFWTLKEWKSKGEEINEIIENQLGWDITTFGSGDFKKRGLMLFTVRNGNLKDVDKGGKNYCEKIMIVEENQITPMHHHITKTEDIINRGGGNLMIQLFNNTKEEKLDNIKVKVSIDGEKLVLEPGTTIKLTPGESITLTKEVYHKFWAEEGHGKVLVGEVSSVNDDRTDNVFLENKGRFDEIDEDVEPLYLLYNDYKKLLSLG